jgi:alkanesulfonate monooxygenase SsuD/methylene tetrahydromethanopterin reductase-like flavin-dependent oxidoreductase (luciferase family)
MAARLPPRPVRFRAMEVGIGLPSTIPGTGRDQVLEWARRAEARGFSTLGTIDRIVYPSHDPLIALAAAAGATERIRLMTAILLAPTRANGAVLAKQAATLDVLSGGRFVLGVAVGRREDDFEAAGVDFHARGRILDEMLEAWEGIWAGEGGIGPPPLEGRRSLLLGGWADAAFTRAARHADGWTGGNCTLEELADGTARLRAAWTTAGREGRPRIVVQPYYALGERAEEAVEHCLRDYYGPGDYTDGIVARAATDAETVRENVAAFAEAGCDELIFFPCDPDPDQVDLLADALR